MDKIVERIISEKTTEMQCKKLRLIQLDETLCDIESGATRVDDALTIGAIVAERNAIEREMRHAYAALFSRYSYDKAEARSAIVGYYVDDEGYAIHPEDGRRLESYPGELVEKDPTTLYKKVVSHGNFFTVEGAGRSVLITTTHDEAAIKEYLANYDIPMMDGINQLYARMSCYDWNRPNIPKTLDKTRRLWEEIGPTVAKALACVSQKRNGKSAFSGKMHFTRKRT